MRLTLKGCFYILLFFSFYCSCTCYKVLVVFPMLSKSHEILGDSCVDLLLEAGHQVTYLKWATGRLKSHPNLTVIDVSLPVKFEDRYNLKSSMSREVDLNNLYEFSMIISGLERKILELDHIQKFLGDPEINFDVAILEWIYGEYIVGIPAVFGCPYIWFSSMQPHCLILSLIGDFSNPAYTSLTTFDSIPPFTFMQRIRSLMMQVSLYLFREFYIQPIEEKAYQEVVVPHIVKRQGYVPSYNELRYNASLVLGNSHISAGTAITLPEAYKAVGGYHIKKNREPLPKDLKSLMDHSTNGVIYFSMGSALKSKDLPVEMIEQILNVFEGLKQTILWKFESDLREIPSNVQIKPWFPQQSILAHPKCVLFISHGGLLSVFESLHFGVPLIGVPVYADQNVNVKSLVQRGIAKEIDLHRMGIDFKAAIEDILTNTSYTAAAKHLSSIYHHRPVPPGVELVHWVENVIETNGAMHMRLIALIVPWYQKCYLDVGTVITVVVILLILGIKRLLLIIKSVTMNRVYMKKMQ